MQFLHHKDFRHWTEVEIMAIFVVGMLAAMFLPIFLTELF